MNNEPLVSVIMIFLDPVDVFFREAIDSVLAQSYLRWELLLIDDGSHETSRQIAKEYIRQNPGKIRYLEHDGHVNRGMSASRNLGLAHCRGDFIAFLDADDVWLTQKLERQMAILINLPKVAMVCGTTLAWHSWTDKANNASSDRISQWGVPCDTIVEAPTLLTLHLQSRSSLPATCSVVVRRKAVEDVSGFEESFTDLYEDAVFFSKIISQKSIFLESSCWAHYRKHPDSCCSLAEKLGSWYPNRTNSPHRIYLQWLEQYLRRQKIENEELWHALENALYPYHHPYMYLPVRLVNSSQKRMEKFALIVGRHILPVRLRHWLWIWYKGKKTDFLKGLRFGDLWRVTPLSREFGYNRGLPGMPIDRYYIENFLARYAKNIRGRVLEIGDNTYTLKFGKERVSKSDVLHLCEGNPQATIIGDLTCAEHIPTEIFDCIVLTQTLQLIFDVRAAIRTLFRILKPGGVLLATLPVITQKSFDQWKDCWCWSFGKDLANRLFSEVFGKDNVILESYGNVLATIAFCYGLATWELDVQEMDYRDPEYPLILTIKAIKPESAS